MIPLFNAIILDVAVVAILLIVIVIGAVKGILHTFINFVLLAGAFALGFAPFMGIVKTPIIDLLSSKIELGVGVANELKLGIYLLYPFIASLAVSLLIYVLLRLIKLLVFVLIKRNLIKDNKLPSRVGKASRVTGAFAGLILYGVVIIAALTVFATPLVGGEKTLKEGYVAKYIEQGDDYLVKLIADEKDYVKIENQVIVKLIMGDFYYKVSAESAEDIVVLGEAIEKKAFAVENLDNIKNKIKYMHHFLRFVTDNALDEEGLEVDGFAQVVEMTRSMVSESVNKMNELHKGQSVPIDAGDITLSVSQLITKLGLPEISKTFSDVFVIN